MNSTRLILLATVALALGIVSTRVQALPTFPPSGPLIKISELSTGSFADPNAQYLVLRMAAGTSNGSNLRGYTVMFYQPDFHQTGSITLAADANRGTRGAPYLIANPAAQTLYHVLADTLYTGQPWATAGYICLFKPGVAPDSHSVQDPNVSKDDCLAYGNVTDSTTYITDPNFPNQPFNPAGGVPRGFIARRISTPGTGSSDRDFLLLNPNEAWPASNRGVVGSPSSTPCGDGNVNGVKQCDAGSNNGILVPGCSSSCRIVGDPSAPTCGNGVVDPGEACDDGSTFDHDGCSSLCQWEFLLHSADPVCGNGIVENPETCDSLATLPTPTCDTNCRVLGPPPDPACGDGTVQEGEQCDGTDCDSTTCAWDAAHTYACGNGIVEPGEECDDGNTASGDGCSADCFVELGAYFHCGTTPNPPDADLPAVVEPGEQCEPTADQGCKNDCTWVTPMSDTNIPATTTAGNSTAGPGVNTTAGNNGAPGSSTTSTGGSGTSGGGASTGGSGSSNTGGADASSSTTTTTGGSTVIKSTSCAQGGAPGLAWTLGAAGLLWSRRKRMACTLP